VCHIELGTRHIGHLVRATLDSARGRLDISCVPHWTRHEADWTSRACHIGLGTRHIGLLVRAILDSARGILDFLCVPYWTRHEAYWTSRACQIGLGTRHIGLLVRAILDSARGILDFLCVPYWTRHEAYWTSRACRIGLVASFKFGQILDPNLCSSCYLNLGLQRGYIGPRTTTTTLDSSIHIGLGAEPQPYDP
jgi:hypothetical protein